MSVSQSVTQWRKMWFSQLLFKIDSWNFLKKIDYDLCRTSLNFVLSVTCSLSKRPKIFPHIGFEICVIFSYSLYFLMTLNIGSILHFVCMSTDGIYLTYGCCHPCYIIDDKIIFASMNLSIFTLKIANINIKYIGNIALFSDT